jgi:hypothetical protein
MKSIIEFLEDNKNELFERMIEVNYFDDEDEDDTVDKIRLLKGYYINSKDELIETDEVCSVVDGFDISFKRKYVKDIYGDANEVEIEINNKKLYCLLYNV